MNQERKLTEQNQNAEETEIDLLELFYYLKAKLVGKTGMADPCICYWWNDSGVYHPFSDHSEIHGNRKDVYDFSIKRKCA